MISNIRTYSVHIIAYIYKNFINTNIYIIYVQALALTTQRTELCNWMNKCNILHDEYKNTIINEYTK